MTDIILSTDPAMNKEFATCDSEYYRWEWYVQYLSLVERHRSRGPAVSDRLRKFIDDRWVMYF